MWPHFNNAAPLLVFSTLKFSKINGHDRNVFKYSRLTGYSGNEHEGGQQEIMRQNKNHIHISKFFKIGESALQQILHPAFGEGPVAEEYKLKSFSLNLPALCVS